MNSKQSVCAALVLLFVWPWAAPRAAEDASLPALLERFEHPAREVWLPAAGELVSIGEKAAHALRQRRARIQNPRTAARVDSLIGQIQRLRAVLSIEPRTLRVGHELSYDVTMVNGSGRRLLLALPVDGSEDGVRDPRVGLEIIAPDGQEASGGPRWCRGGEVETISEHDFHWIGAGRSLRLFADDPGPRRARVAGHWYWTPPGPGLYQVRFVYDSTSRVWDDWRGRSAEPPAAVRKKWQSIYHGRVASDWLTIHVIE